MRLGLEIIAWLLAPLANFHVVFLAVADRHVGVREVGQAQEDFAQFGVGLGGLVVQRGNLVADVAQFGFFGLGLVSLFLAHKRTDFLGGGVASGLELLDCGDGLAALRVESHDVAHLGGKLFPAGGEAFPDVVGVVSNLSDIQHGRQYRAVYEGRKVLTRSWLEGHNRGSLPSSEPR